MASIDSMGVLNSGWGICGFTSSLYALYNNNPSQRPKLAQGAVTPTRMLAEIKTYLRMLQAEGRRDILDDIKTFTRTFGGVHKQFTVTRYIERINSTVTKGADPGNEKFGIALPPHAVVDYLERVCGFRSAKVVDLSHQANEMILGVYDKKSKMKMYGGLAHYLYSRNQKIFSWGQQFGNVEQAMDTVGVGKNWDVCRKIAF